MTTARDDALARADVSHAAIEGLQHELSLAQAELSAFRASAHTREEASRSTIDSLRLQADSRQLELAVSTAEILQLRASVTALESDVTTCSSALSAASVEWQSRELLLNSRVSSALADVDAARCLTEELRDSRDALVIELEAALGARDVAMEEGASFKTLMLDLQATVETLRSQLKTVSDTSLFDA